MIERFMEKVEMLKDGSRRLTPIGQDMDKFSNAEIKAALKESLLMKKNERGTLMDNEEFAKWIVDKLIDGGFLEPGWNSEEGEYYESEDIEAAIRRILMENEKEND